VASFRLSIGALVGVLLVVALGAPLAVADESSNVYHQIALITVPGNALNSFDISFVERSSQEYFLADRSNAGVDEIDGGTNAFLHRFGGFVGFSGANETSGPNGVTVAHDRHELWATDGDSSVRVFDLKTNGFVARIPTGGTKRADEIAYDVRDHIVLVANDADDPPFVTFIDVDSREVVGTVSFPNATNGLEQPVWDPETHRFYLSVPQLGSNPLHGGIAVLDPRTKTLDRVFPVENCQPAGLALGPDQDLALGCSGDAIDAGAAPQTQIMDARSGAILKVITQVGGSDEVWFNPGDKRFYVAARSMPGGPVLGVIDAESNTWITNVPTGPNAHSVAADPINNHIFVPVRGRGILVFDQVE